MNLNTFDLNLLRVFEAVYRDRSVSRAAEALALSQPAVSNALGRLRQKVDDPLFVRSTSGMMATPRAEQLASAVMEGLTAIRGGLDSGLDFDPARSNRRFRLLMTDIGELLFLPSMLSKIAHGAPNIDIDVRETRLTDYDELLEGGMADIAIGKVRLSGQLCSELVHSSEFVALLGSNSPYLHSGPDGGCAISYASYLKAPHVVVRQRGMTQDPVRDALGPDAPSVRIALTIPHVGAHAAIMADTDLIATLPAAVASCLIASGDLCSVALPFPVELIFAYQWWHRRNRDDPGHEWLRMTIRMAGLRSSCGMALKP